MKVLLIDIDSTIQNLALHKVEKYHRDRGDEVVWNMPLMAHNADRVYVSCVFSRNREKAAFWEVYPQALIGGSGYSLSVTLPPEIEAVEPRINMGFTTRGCIRNCAFCIVPQKEGTVRIVGDLRSLWDGKSKQITLMDNNILAVPDHFEYICRQARELGVRIDFNQGLDHRLLTPELARVLREAPTVEYRFAYDSPAYRGTVDRAIDMLKAKGIRYAIWYVLVGFNTTLREDVERLNHLRVRRQRAFVQRYSSDRVYIPLARWGNTRSCSNMTLHQFMTHPGKAVYNHQWLDRYMAEVGEDQMMGPVVERVTA